MMQFPKIHLSSPEIELMQNENLILTKNLVLDKIKNLLETIQMQQEMYVQEKNLHIDVRFDKPPKISKGEYYLGLPYIILDYPRHASNGNLFFIRTMFWWGNFFSSTLHLSGDFVKTNKQNLKNAYESMPDFYIGIHEDPWIHHFGENNYKKISAFTKKEFEQHIDTSSHVKMAAMWPLSEWADATESLLANWKFLLGCAG